jgi:hypothetical protein
VKILSILLLLLTSSVLFAQDLGSVENASQDFRGLSRSKRVLDNQISESAIQLGKLQYDLSRLRSETELQDEIRFLNDTRTANQTLLDASTQELDSERERSVRLEAALSAQPDAAESADLSIQLEDANRNVEFIQRDIEYYTTEVTTRYKAEMEILNSELTQRTALQTQIGNLQTDMATKDEELINLDNEIADLLNRDNFQNSFRLSISVAFTILVAVVIIGFYFIAWKKEALAHNIFSGEKGIQFITLFLIIISIILFGIMGTLESRELSALLGALSGYILGKTSSVSSREQEHQPTITP